MNAADMHEVVRTLQHFTPLEKLDRMIREHAPDITGHCPVCHTTPGCTLYAAARSARYVKKVQPSPAHPS